MNFGSKVGLLFLGFVAVLGAPAVASYEIFYSTVGNSALEPGIYRFTPDGFPQGRIDTKNSTGIVTDGRDLFVIDANRLEQFTTTGDFVGTIATLSDSSVGLQHDPDGNFYVWGSDAGVSKLDASGNLVTQFTAPEVFGANGDLDGNIYVSVRGAIEVYDSSGNFLSSTATGFDFNGDIAIDHSGGRLFHTAQNAMLSTFDISGGSLVLQDTVALPTGGISFTVTYDELTDHLFIGAATAAYEVTAGGKFVNSYGGGLFGWGVVAVPVPEPCFGLVAVAGFWVTGRRRFALGK